MHVRHVARNGRDCPRQQDPEIRRSLPRDSHVQCENMLQTHFFYLPSLSLSSEQRPFNSGPGRVTTQPSTSSLRGSSLISARGREGHAVGSFLFTPAWQPAGRSTRQVDEAADAVTETTSEIPLAVLRAQKALCPSAQLGSACASASRVPSSEAREVQDQMRRCQQEPDDFEDIEALWGSAALHFIRDESGILCRHRHTMCAGSLLPVAWKLANKSKRIET